MRDVESGSWWQQISGEAIRGRLKGQKLVPVDFDEISFQIWKRENPDGRVLRPDEKIAAENKYEAVDWEDQVAKMPVRINTKVEDYFDPRTLVVGVTVNGQSKAYPFSALKKQNPIIDSLGNASIVLMLAADDKSVRGFERMIDDKKLEFFKDPETDQIVDAETGSIWDFSGRALKGEFAGRQLKKITINKDFWFDWRTYHPDTLVYRLESR